MCRLILASGTFEAADVVAAAVAMGSGQTADHDGALLVHPHGWGAVWNDPAAPGGLSVHRDVRPVAESAYSSVVPGVRTDFLAVHVRNSQRTTHLGPRFTHPLQRPADDWYFMHNGSMPTVHRKLGLAESAFDSAEYFDYIVPAGAERLDEADTLDRLRAIPPGGNSGNAIAVRPGRAYVIHWSPPENPWPRYFTLHRLSRPDLQVVASEVIPALAPATEWEAMPPDTVTELLFDRERQAS